MTDMALEAAGFGIRSMNDPVRGWHLHHYTAQHKGLVDSSSAFGAYFSSITAPPIACPACASSNACTRSYTRSHARPQARSDTRTRAHPRTGPCS
jgi:hypothetical protein